MPIRTRTRYPGDIDPALGQTTPMIYLPYWVSGRFYEACFSVVTTTSAQSLAGTSVITSPFIVPNVVTATAIGVEVTSAATAGNTMRLAIYNSDPLTGWPSTLKLDAGQIAIDATGFKSATISLILEPGLYWASHVASATATYRAYSTTVALQFLPASDFSTVFDVQAVSVFIANIGATVNAMGFPAYFILVGTNHGSLQAQAPLNTPRILIGV